MKAHRGLLAGVMAAVLAGTGSGVTAVSGRQAEGPPPGRPSGPGAPGCDLPVLRHHHYKMAGRVRPLLFWIGRDDVGIGEIVWHGDEGAVAYELLIGTDAAKAPRGINRWGYLLEESRPAGTRILGVMTTSDEATISDVTSRGAGPQPVGRFKGLDARIAEGVSRSATETIETEREFSVRDKEIIVGRIAAKLREAEVREVPVPDGVRPGFLMAVAELVNDTMAARRDGEQALRRLKGRTIPYIYSRKLYDLKLNRVEPARPPAGGPSRGARVKAEFETLNRSAGSRNTFELEYAADGPLAGVPTLIRYKPRWWLEAVLTLEPEVPPQDKAGTQPAGR
ncbi:MAG: hypothetical protein ACM3H9_08975 [Rhodospirillaceae bacterium]